MTNILSQQTSIHIQWWCGLSYNQQQFISHYYQTDVDKSDSKLIIAYDNRHDLRQHPNWPVTTFTQI